MHVTMSIVIFAYSFAVVSANVASTLDKYRQKENNDLDYRKHPWFQNFPVTTPKTDEETKLEDSNSSEEEDEPVVSKYQNALENNTSVSDFKETKNHINSSEDVSDNLDRGRSIIMMKHEEETVNSKARMLDGSSNKQEEGKAQDGQVHVTTDDKMQSGKVAVGYKAETEKMDETPKGTVDVKRELSTGGYRTLDTNEKGIRNKTVEDILTILKKLDEADKVKNNSENIELTVPLEEDENKQLENKIIHEIEEDLDNTMRYLKDILFPNSFIYIDAKFSIKGEDWRDIDFNNKVSNKKFSFGSLQDGGKVQKVTIRQKSKSSPDLDVLVFKKKD